MASYTPTLYLKAEIPLLFAAPLRPNNILINMAFYAPTLDTTAEIQLLSTATCATKRHCDKSSNMASYAPKLDLTAEDYDYMLDYCYRTTVRSV